ncbi:Pls/PosA family non-ribosomal peptide synthetase [Legionella fairfieldensis]|uniref:Pls/PosA family non-ribosomal peptide synthetase n=1 Tax=Legionella fairfieldensis TaxID=45064 RepID=UPI000B0BB55F|nr:Pls/PosA family non-ribosomal peptide synthetase [Legionella fairfieldensis]
MNEQNKDVIQLQQFFERSADNFPDNIALVCDNRSFTYQELEQRANQLANFLLSEGIRPTSIVGILIERSADCYIAILAILKTGATYVPIEVEHPVERINYIFSDLSFQAVLISSLQQAREGLEPPQMITIDDQLKERLANQSVERPVLLAGERSPDDLSYIIYTSGSTGKPKGVEITHRSICHYVRTVSTIYQMTEQDRVYQGFSLAFDASLEEIWMAFSHGASLIACTDKDTRSGVGLIEFLQQHQVSVFSTVPTLLSTLEGGLAELRLLILGGEACTANLIKRWSRPGLRILNTYGPTEATVITTYSECHPDKPMTIGQPLPGCEVLILDADLQCMPDGEEGELYIGGCGLARGYANLPEMTAIKFVPHPFHKDQRLYRTGDLALRSANGDIQFAGRADDQIKLRGFRIELNEIETVMLEHEAINQAVVLLHNLEQPTLIAYLLVDKKVKFDLEQFKSFLRSRLPHYMIPGCFEMVEMFPLLASGKVDRKQLPLPQQIIKTMDYEAPSTVLEQEIAHVWENVIQHSPISISADFFYDLGGHSLIAAKVVSNLRQIPALENISILDLYQNPTIKQLAHKFEKSSAEKPASSQQSRPRKQKNNATPSWMYYLCAVGQFFGVLFQCTINAWQLIAVIICYTWATEQYPLFSWHSFGIFLSLFLIMPVASLALTISAKWLLLGRVKPGKYPLWGWFYLRWWLVERLQKNIFSPRHLIGSPLIVLYYRLLGAKIGKNCYIASVYLSTHDTLEIGDNTSIGYDAKLLGYVVEDGWLKIGKTTIGNNCFLGARSVVSIDTFIEDNAALDDMSMLPRYSIIPTGQFFSGSPACLAIAPFNHITKQNKVSSATRTKTVTYGFLHYFCLTFAMAVYYLTYLPGIMVVTHFYEHSSYVSTIFFATITGAVIFMTLYFFSIFVCKKLIMDKVKPGTYPLKSFYYLRQWTIVQMLDRDELYVMADSLFFPVLLRFLGAKIGKKVEMGEVPHIIPDLVTIEEGGFTASVVALAWPNVFNDSICFAPVTIGKRGFAGNMSLLPSGARIGEGGLLGCMSITPPNNKAADANTAWLGSPAVFLPKRELVTGYSEQQTFNPSKRLYLTRLAIEFFRIITPTTFSLIMLFNILYALDFLLGKYSLLTTLLVLPVMELGIVVSLVAALVGLKWLILGKIKPATKPIWDIFIWKNDVIEYSYNYFVNPFFTNMILGTPFVSWLYRSYGAKIGKRVFIDTADFTEFDLIKVSDEVCLNAEAVMQTHLYEDRIFKMSPIEIKQGCNVGTASTVLYNTVMEENSTLGNFSLLMKGERLPADTSWRGVPAQAVSVDEVMHSDNLLIPI